MPYIFAYPRRILIASATDFLNEATSRLGKNKSCSSMFLSSRSLTCDSISFEVTTINSASCFFGEFSSSFTTVSEKLTMHFKGVTISCVTLDVNMWSNLLSASILANFWCSVTSLKVATWHCSWLKIRFDNDSVNFRCSLGYAVSSLDLLGFLYTVNDSLPVLMAETLRRSSMKEM